MARFEINGTQAFIVKDDGTRINLQQALAEVTKDLGGTMDVFRAEKNGNLSVSFSDKYFPRRGQIDGPGRSALNALKARVQLAIYDACIEHGIPANNMTFSEGFTGERGWVGAKRIYFNLPRDTAGAVVNPESVPTLVHRAMELGVDAEEVEAKMDKWTGDKEPLLIGWLKNRIKVHETSKTTRAISDEVGSEVPEEPESDDTPDLGNM